MAFSFSLGHSTDNHFPFCGFSNDNIIILTTGKIASSFLHSFTPGNDTVFCLSDLFLNYKIQTTPHLNENNKKYIETFTEDLENIFSKGLVTKKFTVFIRNPFKRMIGSFIEDYWTEEIKNKNKIKQILQYDDMDIPLKEEELNKLLFKIDDLKNQSITENTYLIRKVSKSLLREYIDKKLYGQGHDTNWLLLVYELKNKFNEYIDIIDIDETNLYNYLTPYIPNITKKRVNSHKDLSEIIDSIEDKSIIDDLKKIYFNEIHIYQKLTNKKT